METCKEARERLDALVNEERALPSNLSAAVSAGNASEATRLKGRARDLPSELWAARAVLHRARIEALEAEQKESFAELQRAKEEGKKKDSVIAAQLRALDEERVRLTKESLTALTWPQVIQSEINKRSGEISRLLKELDELLQS